MDENRRIEFSLNGRDAVLICPDQPAPGMPWVWRAEFLGAFDYADRALLARGWHVAYLHASDLYGCPEAVEAMYGFYRHLTAEYALNPSPVIFGFSRGGLYAVNFALAHPGCFAALYLDAPVLDIRSWPGGMGKAERWPREWAECLTCYGLTEQTTVCFNQNPVDRAADPALKGAKILLVAGLADRVVPHEENGAVFAARRRAAGETVETILKPDCDHHPHSLSDPSPIVRFAEDAFRETQS